MPTPGPIRKEILSALENTIIPALWQRKMPLGCISPPLEFPPGINRRLISKTVPQAKQENILFPIQNRWSHHNLATFVYPFLGIIYEGIVDNRTFIDAQQSTKFKLPSGIYAIRARAPSALLSPPGVPRDGGIELWEDTTPPPPVKILWMLWAEDTLLHTHIHDGNGQRHISHSLQVSDPGMAALRGLFIEELQNTRTDQQEAAQAILLSIMLRLQKKLQASQARIANTSRSAIAPTNPLSSDNSAGSVCREAAIFIQMHLHEPLTLPAIAKKVNLSPAHLNRLFQRLHGVSVMRYVRTQRIIASQNILKSGTENIAEVAQLVGFKRTNLYCRAFRQETGLTPGQYRRQNRTV